MFRWFFKFYLFILKIIAVIYVFLVPCLTIWEHFDPWSYAIETRSAYRDSHFFIVAGGSWNSGIGHHRQILVLVPKTIAAPIILEIDKKSDQLVTRVGYYLFLVICALYVYGLHTIVRLVQYLTALGSESESPAKFPY